MDTIGIGMKLARKTIQYRGWREAVMAMEIKECVTVDLLLRLGRQIVLDY